MNSHFHFVRTTFSLALFSKLNAVITTHTEIAEKKNTFLITQLSLEIINLKIVLVLIFNLLLDYY